MHNGRTITLPDHDAALERAVRAQRAMSRCAKGSRRWTKGIGRLRSERRRMCDRDAVRAQGGPRYRGPLRRAGPGSAQYLRDGRRRQRSQRNRRLGEAGSQPASPRKPLESHSGRADKRARGERGNVLKLPAMDSSRTDSACGHVDTNNRNRKRFRCTACGRADDADVNAARVMRQRTMRWLAVREEAKTDAEATRTLWTELKAACDASSRTGTRCAEAKTKPACAPQVPGRRRGCAVDSASTRTTTAGRRPKSLHRR